MRTTNEKIALHEFAEKFFGIKMQPYQKQIIELIEKGGKRSLRLKPTLVQIRPPSSIKLQQRLLSGQHMIYELMKDINVEELISNASEGSFLNAITYGQSIIEFNPKHRPMMIVIDDPIAPYRHIPPIQHEHAIVAIKATIL
jgi:hypothetical protein